MASVWTVWTLRSLFLLNRRLSYSKLATQPKVLSSPFEICANCSWGNWDTPGRKRKILPNFKIILPKFHFIIRKFYLTLPRKWTIATELLRISSVGIGIYHHTVSPLVAVSQYATTGIVYRIGTQRRNKSTKSGQRAPILRKKGGFLSR